MLPRETIATAQIPGGETLTLVSHGRDFIIMLGRDELMGTRMQFSEEQLAVLTLAELEASKPRILIGGFGMGFTYRAALAHLPAGGSVTVAELVPEILEWARGPLAHLSAESLDDPRGEVILCNVEALIDDANDGTSPKYDAILLDVDNGPDGIVVDSNFRLYTRTGIAKAKDALNPGGIMAVWSAAPDHKFTTRLKDGGFEVEVREVRARPNNKGPRHTIWFARKR
ncbi:MULTISPECIES: spermidine synthase [Citromicrobium]|uniref:spermine/spermidine synthase domain-containing protein n=1 Tax=Citromicrobium TaxID=72173 RepID=UPI0001DD074C|nr:MULTISPECIES: spermidine synthase [Citromicrobium]ALG61653.1 spermidine synthase [Citromicrobium sp. JL477]KPM12900.1 spermidine synthase [Citromicrobium sp. JL1351]KPM21070.1 spermidine synthase [Citromicrobium sp. JL31]KPM27055.1 spermidine synthase [Citromicrobium sp. JL2201]